MPVIPKDLAMTENNEITSGSLKFIIEIGIST
jgi:hypothetical protein